MKTSSRCQLSPRRTLMPLQISSIVGTELLAPDSNGFIRDDDSTFGEKILDIREAHAEAVINLGGVADDFRREPIAVIARLVALHRTSLSVLRPKLTVPWGIQDIYAFVCNAGRDFSATVRFSISRCSKDWASESSASSSLLRSRAGGCIWPISPTELSIRS
jgi:hypothetical protein